MHLSPRLTLQIDTVTCGAMAVLLLVLAGPLGGWLDLPVDLLRGVGIFLVPWTALLVWFASRERIGQGVMQFVIAVNVLWVIGSIGLLASNQADPNGWGMAFVLVQATAVASLVVLQIKRAASDSQPAM